MSTIPRIYCVVQLFKNTRIFSDIVAAYKTQEEAYAAKDRYEAEAADELFTYVVWPVILDD
jgi:hypothetical protein